MKQIVITLDGLSCANCGGKIERAMNLRSDINLARLDFASSKMILDVEDDFDSSVYDEIRKQITAIEDVGVHFEDDEKPQNQKKERPWLLSISVGVLALLLSLLVEDVWAKVLVLLAYGYIGYPVLIKAGKRIISKQWFDENFLMSIATLGAIAIGELPEAVGVMLFYTVGEYFQDKAVLRSKDAISSLLDLTVEEALVVQDKEMVVTKPEHVRIGDLLFVGVGRKVACDGFVVDGNSMMDVKALSGESLPVDVTVDSYVQAGSINLSSPVFIKVTNQYQDSSVAKMVRYMEEASKKKAKVETMMNRFAAVYTPTVVGLSLLVMLTLLLMGEGISTAVYRGLIFLVISCPCALVISIPLSYFASMGYSSRHGILFKGGLALEAAKQIDTVYFDKTGTLTKGELVVDNIIETSEVDETLILSYAKSLEQFSSHPIAKAILSYRQDVKLLQVEQISEMASMGVSGVIHHHQIELRKITPEEISALDVNHQKLIEASVSTMVGVFKDTILIGILLISDDIKPTSIRTIEDLKSKGIYTGMLSGDRFRVVKYVEKLLKLDEAFGQLLPDGKVEKTQARMRLGHKVAFVGDGINDAAVLTTSHLGIAMGQLGSDVAIKAADVVLLKDDPADVVRVFEIAKQTHRIIVQNLILVFAVKGLVLILGALGIAGMWEAVFADVGVALLAITNAMRVLYGRT